MKTAPIFLAVIWFAGCTSFEHSSIEKEERLQGHVTLVAGGADFIVTKPEYRRFQAPNNCFPESVWDYLHTQPAHKDGSSLDGKGKAVWVDVSGHIEHGPSHNEVFTATNVHKVSPAHSSFLAWRRLFGSGNRLADYVD